MKIPENRSAGILMHITSLPGRWGIGDLGPSAYEFAERLVSCGVRYWQMLPLGPTGYGNSPYSGRSTFAGNELLISPELLMKDGFLSPEDLKDVPAFPADHVDFNGVRTWKMPLLRKAAVNALKSADFRKRLREFREANSYWLDDYAVYMILYTRYNDARWYSVWDRKEGAHDAEVCRRILEEKREDADIWQALQLIFDTQCRALRSYCNSRGLLTIGDIPIFVGMDSADAWSKPELFRRGPSGAFSEVSGVPPDNFSADGQLWGTPVYDWDYHTKTGFSWWISRVRRCLELNNVLRIDHFKGFDAYYAIPAGATNAVSGTWTPVPGKRFFKVLRETLGEVPIIAEDLGNMTRTMEELRLENGFPGMKLAQFGFEFDEDGSFDKTDDFLPANYDRMFVAYTGTHDNDTTRGWFNSLQEEQKASVLSYLGCDEATVVDTLVDAVMTSRADLAVIPMQDILGLDGWARMNYPSTCNGVNWTWRMEEGAFSADRMEFFRNLVRKSNR